MPGNETHHSHLVQADFVKQEITKLQREGWYGRVTLILEHGIIKRIMKEESIIPPK